MRNWIIAVFAAVATIAVLAGGCGFPATTSSALIGKRVPGTGPEWTPIGIGRGKAPSVAGAVTPPVFTAEGGLSGFVLFFEFANSRAAAAFYANPQPVPQMFEHGPALSPLAGRGPVPAPSRWLNLSWCIWTGGPDPQGVPLGAPFAGPDSTGKCKQGALQSVGIASITQRGDMVFFVQADDRGAVLNVATPNLQEPAYSDWVAQNVKLSVGTLSLLRSVGVS